MDIEQTVDARGEEYGDWKKECELNLKLMQVIQSHSHYCDLEPFKQEGIRRIVMKLVRIINGNSNNVDSWADIAGYSLVVMRNIN